MNEAGTKKFKELVNEMEILIIKEVPALKNTITILRNKERNEETSYYKEIQKKEIEIDALRKIYKQIMSDLMELDCDKAKLKVNEIIKTRRKLDINYRRDLQEANQGEWQDKFFRNLPI